MMERDDTRKLLKDRKLAKPGMKLIELQRAEWDRLGVDKDFGCNCLDKVEADFPGDSELHDLKVKYIHVAERSYLRALADRAPTKLEHTKPMPREIICEFFDACNTRVQLPEFQKKLVESIIEHKGPDAAGQLMIKMQRDMLEVFGIEREHGCRELSAIPKNFPKDQDLHKRFSHWQRMAQGTMQQCIQAAGGGGSMNEHLNAALMQSNPMLEKHGDKAREALDKMTPEERGQFMQKLQQKIAV